MTSWFERVLLIAFGSIVALFAMTLKSSEEAMYTMKEEMEVTQIFLQQARIEYERASMCQSGDMLQHVKNTP